MAWGSRVSGGGEWSDVYRTPPAATVARGQAADSQRSLTVAVVAWGGGKPVDKPGSVVDSHSSRRTVTSTLKQPTRKQREPRPCFPIWPCSGWGLPCRPCCHVRGELLPHRFTLTCPGLHRGIGGLLSVALSVTSRCPVVNRHRALWSPDFPLGARFAPLAQRLPDRLPSPIIPGSGGDRAGTATRHRSRPHARSPA
jgi:hypothetical protein